MTRRAKILIVDDDELALEIVTAKLSERYDIVSTQDPGSVLRLARENEPDLIICDFDMPEMDGGEVSAALLADEELKYIPLLFFTGLATSGDLNRMRQQLGGRRAVAKDAPLAQLIARIEELLKAE
jgi:two-component system OmpR family response regulator